MSVAFIPANSFARALRAGACAVGTMMLLLQLLGPALAKPGQGTWIEICSDAGAVLVQVDLDNGTDAPSAPCPKCATCALCAVADAAPLPDQPEYMPGALATNLQGSFCAAYPLSDANWLWPETRGPPTAPEINQGRTLRGPLASTLKTGGAPWL